MALNCTIGDRRPNGRVNEIYKATLTEQDLLFPSPAETMTVLDQHPGSLNDPSFWVPDPTRWIDLPGSLHQNAGTVAFADGHVETHVWKSSVRNAPSAFSSPGVSPAPGDIDVAWFSFHSQRRGPETY